MNWIFENQQSLLGILPESLLVLFSFLLLFTGKTISQNRRLTLLVGILGLGVFLWTSFLSLLPFSHTTFSQMVVWNEWSFFFRIFFGTTSLVTLCFFFTSYEYASLDLKEIVSTLLMITAGLSFLAASTDFLMILLSFETVSLLSYVLVSFKRDSKISSEAGIKYLLFGATASGIMIFGISYLFGLAGSTNLTNIEVFVKNLSQPEIYPLLSFSFLCIFVGVGFKIAAVPFHMWCPDVYEGAPLPITTFLSVAPKAAGFALAIRLLDCFQGFPGFQFQNFLVLISILTMTWGNIAALPQKNLKRLLAYSSIAHAGYLGMGLATVSFLGIQALLFYLIPYLFMNVGAFFAVFWVSNRTHDETLDSFRGLGWRSPWLAIGFSLALFSLVGLPPFAGFLGKIWLFAAVIEKEMYVLAFFGILNTALSLYYYVKIVKVMFLEKSEKDSNLEISFGSKCFLLFLNLPTVLLIFFWEPIWNWMEEVTQAIWNFL